MTPAVPHSGLCATAASELPSRTPRVMIHSVAGWLSSRSASPRTRSTSSIDSPHGNIDIAFTGTGFGDVEDVTRLGDGGRRVAGVGQPIAQIGGNVVVAQHREGVRTADDVAIVAVVRGERLPVDRVHHGGGIVVTAAGLHSSRPRRIAVRACRCRGCRRTRSP